MEETDGSSTGERTGLAGTIWKDHKAIRGNIRATHVLTVHVSGETMDVIWGRCVLGTSIMGCFFQSQQGRTCGTQQTSIHSEESSNTHCWWDVHLTNRHTRHTCQPSTVPPLGQQSPFPSRAMPSNAAHYGSTTQPSKTSSQMIC